MEQLYTIGQVSKLKGVSPRMLRYYDQLGSWSRSRSMRRRAIAATRSTRWSRST